MELSKYKTEIRKAYKIGNVQLVKAIAAMSELDDEIDADAREEIEDYGIIQAANMVQMKRSTRKTNLRKT
jgi:hypothetical protein